MRVLFLGAGASAPAGYPLAGDLLPALEEAVRIEHGFRNLRDAWAGWREFRDRARGVVRRFLRNPNPEVVFSFLDLNDAAEDSEARARLRAAFRGVKMPAASRTKQLTDAHAARGHLLICLDWYFSLRHFDDGKPENRARRDYLRALLGTLDPGDVVVTLNWDTTVERTLGELGVWNPTLGYGFPRPLLMNGEGDAQLLESPIRVLKLHGSFGWYTHNGALYFDDALFLQPFGFTRDGKPLWLTDPKEPESGTGPPEDRILLHPSFLKQVRGPEMQNVWAAADRALREATEVRVIGYSLPASDGAARSLLNPLRARIEAGAVEVRVSDPNREARERWQALLGERATIDEERFG